LLFHCTDDMKAPPLDARAAPVVRPDDELHDALETSLTLAIACIESVKRTFMREQIAGSVPGKPPANRAPQRAADLKEARVFEAVLSETTGEVVTFDAAVGVAISGLADSGLFHHGDRDNICGIDHRTKALVAWSVDTAPTLLAKLRAPKPPPPLALMYWRWCDRTIDAKPLRPFTCAVGLTWIAQPSGAIVASAVGVGVGKPGTTGTARDRDWAGYLAAMERAEQQVRETVLGWK
jgi:hypothetical protein